MGGCGGHKCEESLLGEGLPSWLILQLIEKFPSPALIDLDGFEILLPIKSATRWGFFLC